MKSLITGGAGFIGSHLAEKLLEQGQDVFVIDNLWTGKLENLSKVQKNNKLHLVIDTILNESVMNDKGTEAVLKLANKFKKKVLIASTSEIYGKHMDHTLAEDDNRVMGSVKKRRWAYACSKTLDEFLALAYFDEKKLPVVIVRLFNTVGPRQTGRYGMVLPNFVQSALLGKPIPVFGDGQQSRSFTHVDDVVAALIKLMDEPKAEGDVFNVGNDHEVTIEGLAQQVKEMTGSNSELEYIPYEKAYGPGFEDMERRCPNIDKVRDLIGYNPSHDLKDIVQSVIDYFKE